jgi:hypothetical protein
MNAASQMALDQAYDRLGAKLPDFMARLMVRLRRPGARWIRIPLGVLCLAGSLLWFLPALGLWMAPVGLLLLAQDLPFLRAPVGRGMLRLLDWWDGLMRRFKRS